MFCCMFVLCETLVRSFVYARKVFWPKRKKKYVKIYVKNIFVLYALLNYSLQRTHPREARVCTSNI